MSFFKKLFGKKTQPTTQAEGLNKPIKEIVEDRKNYTNIGQNIYPVLKAANDPRILHSLQTNNPILSKKIADDLLLCFNLDVGERYEMISQDFLNQVGLKYDDIEQVAIRNLQLKVNQNCKIGVMDLSEKLPGAKPFYKVEMDANFNPSLMIIDEFWNQITQQVVKSNLIAVTIPAKNLLFFSDFRVMESFRTMRPFSSEMYKASIAENIHLSENTYVRKNGVWIKYLNTPEQWGELMDQ